MNKEKEQINKKLVQKKDGTIVKFSFKKILISLNKILKNLTEDEKNNIETKLKVFVNEYQENIISTTTIFKKINDILIEKKFFSEALELENNQQEKELLNIENLDINKEIARLQDRDKALVNENANKDSMVFNTGRDLTAGLVAKNIGLKMLPRRVAKAHQRGQIHYHDLDYSPYQPMTNCCLIDFKNMLSNGFKIGNADVETPKSIGTATAQMAQIIANVASSQYGGCSADRIDEVLAPYAKLNYEKNLEMAKKWITEEESQENFALEKTKKDIYDAMQSLEYEINTLYSSQGQTPFTSLGFGLGEDFFAREIQKAILKVRIQGLGKERRTAIFPKLIFVLKSGLNMENTSPNYDIKKLALDCATRRMYPDVLMFDTLTKIIGSCKTPMGCRSFLPAWQDTEDNFIESGRMNLGVVTLNLPRIALESAKDKNLFWDILRERLDICEEALIYRANRCCEAIPDNAPILYKHGAFGVRLQDCDKVDVLFKKKRATVSLGYIGLYEVATTFYGPNWESNMEAKNFTLNILKELKHAADNWTKKYDYWFSVYATPSESLTDRFCRLDKELFGSIENITAKDYYTNSYHYDVRKNPTPFEKIDFEKDYPYYSSGGFIHYCEYPVLKQNPKALEAVWDFAYDKIGYLGTNTPIDRCYECNYEGEFLPTKRGFKCPNCKNKNPETCDVVKRTCGYLGNPQARPMIRGRHKEIIARKKHMC